MILNNKINILKKFQKISKSLKYLEPYLILEKNSVI